MNVIPQMRVWWCRAYSDADRHMVRIGVATPDEAVKVIDILAASEVNDEHIYFNVSGLEVLVGDEWDEWYNDNGEDIADYANRLLEEV